MDGEVVSYEMGYGLGSPKKYNVEEGFMNAEAEIDDYFNAIGDGRLRRNMEKKSKQRQDRRNERTQSKADARRTRTQSKIELAKAQQESAKASQLGVQADVAMAKALGKNQPKEEKGLSTGAKVGIAVGVVAVLGIVGFIVYKKMKKK